jgi:large subunit ribosomal protein L10
MRAEKKFISSEYVERLNESPFFIVADYHGLKVSEFAELRSRLGATKSEIHVVKNSIFNIAAKECGIENLGELAGQLAVVTGNSEVSAAAKVLKTFQSEFEKPEMQFGYLGEDRLEPEDLKTLADLPPLEILRGKLLGVLQAPAGNLVRLLNTPASQLAQVLKARVDKGE